MTNSVTTTSQNTHSKEWVKSLALAALTGFAMGAIVVTRVSAYR